MQRRVLAPAVGSAFTIFIHAALADPAATALPTGGQVTAGAASISTPSAGAMRIDQATDRTIINWQTFSIGSASSVRFVQPSSSSVALNRVVGANPSEIFGRLTANGQVFLTNPNGVLFAPGASVEVGGLFASTLSISDPDFLAGRYVFQSNGTAGSVVNRGSIVAPNGYAALAGPQVRNEGIIVARLGTAALAAGDRVTLDMVGDGLISVSVNQAALNASAVNTGTLQADGGRVVMTARTANALLDTVVNTSGVVRANALVERAGEIVLDAGANGVVAATGTVEAIGGSIVINGGAGGTPQPIRSVPSIQVPPGLLVISAPASTQPLPSGGQSNVLEWSTFNVGTTDAVTLISGGVAAQLTRVTAAPVMPGSLLLSTPAAKTQPGGIGVILTAPAIGVLPALPLVIQGAGVAIPADITLTR